MSILNRKQFKEFWNKNKLGGKDSPLWIPEQGRRPSRWFVKIRPTANPFHNIIDYPDHENYWLWCEKFCRGQILCYSSDGETEEWWGFTHRADIVVWLLKWA